VLTIFFFNFFNTLNSFNNYTVENNLILIV
jgi:hypothetical protein